MTEYRLELEFEDGARGTVDLSHFVGRGVFQIWNDPEAFSNVRIGASGELLWEERIDLCPDSLYLRATGKSPQEIFAGLRHAGMHA